MHRQSTHWQDSRRQGLLLTLSNLWSTLSGLGLRGGWPQPEATSPRPAEMHFWASSLVHTLLLACTQAHSHQGMCGGQG